MTGGEWRQLLSASGLGAPPIAVASSTLVTWQEVEKGISGRDKMLGTPRLLASALATATLYIKCRRAVRKLWRLAHAATYRTRHLAAWCDRRPVLNLDMPSTPKRVYQSKLETRTRRRCLSIMLCMRVLVPTSFCEISKLLPHERSIYPPEIAGREARFILRTI